MLGALLIIAFGSPLIVAAALVSCKTRKSLSKVKKLEAQDGTKPADPAQDAPAKIAPTNVPIAAKRNHDDTLRDVASLKQEEPSDV
ncbi:hypothetical protein QR680_018598 [Steinernema hermaphroditum]|uniref:Uncharacterized protein n=1 Tax=Steinernema hermaphroditum TaxID=289476 RepID=A0AA39HKS9_9BILA|nr:hypothetical protein QR680_018598 [Steinernema hermaphroditum]